MSKLESLMIIPYGIYIKDRGHDKCVILLKAFFL